MLQHTAKFPKTERFRLAKHLDDALFAFHEAILRAAQSNKPRPLLYEADIQLDLLRVYLRLALESHYTKADQYAYASQLIREIGNLLGAWIKRTHQG